MFTVDFHSQFPEAATLPLLASVAPRDLWQGITSTATGNKSDTFNSISGNLQMRSVAKSLPATCKCNQWQLFWQPATATSGKISSRLQNWWQNGPVSPPESDDFFPSFSDDFYINFLIHIGLQNVSKIETKIYPKIDDFPGAISVQIWSQIGSHNPSSKSIKIRCFLGYSPRAPLKSPNSNKPKGKQAFS